MTCTTGVATSCMLQLWSLRRRTSLQMCALSMHFFPFYLLATSFLTPEPMAPPLQALHVVPDPQLHIRCNKDWYAARIIDGSLEVKLPTYRKDDGRSVQERRSEKRQSKGKESEKKEDPEARNVKNAARGCVFSDVSSFPGVEKQAR